MKAIRLLLLLLPFSATAQQPTDSTVYKLLGLRSERFRMDPPDSTFTPMDNGYESESGATVIYQLLPVTFDRMLSDIEKDRGNTTDSFVFRKPVVIGKLSGHLVKMFYQSPDSNFENMYGLLFFYPYGKETMNISAIYPVSQDKALYPKLERTFASLRRVQE